MSEEEKVLEQDAKPKATTTRKRAGKRNLTKSIEASLIIPASIWAARDSCGVVFRDELPEIAKAINELAQQDKHVYKFFSGVTEAKGWAGVALALAPVGMAVAEHHIMPLMDRGAHAQDADDGYWASPDDVPINPEPEQLQQQEPIEVTYVNPNQVISE